MKCIQLPDSDIMISRLSFGTGSLHHITTSRERQYLLAAVIDHGFTHLDTAPYYGFGLAEREIGRFLGIHKVDITIASKVGLYPPVGSTPGISSVWLRKLAGKVIPVLSRPVIDWSISRASASLENTLNSLGRECVDLLFLHEVVPGLIDTEEFVDWLTKQRQLGKLRNWGLAGPLQRFESLIRSGNSLAQVLQVQDQIDREDHELMNLGRRLQITYGAISANSKAGRNVSALQALKEALNRNPDGSVLVSSRNIAHLSELATVVG